MTRERKRERQRRSSAAAAAADAQKKQEAIKAIWAPPRGPKRLQYRHLSAAVHAQLGGVAGLPVTRSTVRRRSHLGHVGRGSKRCRESPRGPDFRCRLGIRRGGVIRCAFSPHQLRDRSPSWQARGSRRATLRATRLASLHTGNRRTRTRTASPRLSTSTPVRRLSSGLSFLAASRKVSSLSRAKTLAAVLDNMAECARRIASQSKWPSQSFVRRISLPWAGEVNRRQHP